MTAKHEPTDQNRKTAAAMCGYGIPHAEIARVIGVDPKTLRLHYREELDTGHTKANAKVAESLFMQATGAPAVYDQHKNKIRDEQSRVPSAAIWWTKARMGWKETIKSEHTGKDGGPIEVSARDRISSRIAGIAARKREGGNPPDADGG